MGFLAEFSDSRSKSAQSMCDLIWLKKLLKRTDLFLIMECVMKLRDFMLLTTPVCEFLLHVFAR